VQIDGAIGCLRVRTQLRGALSFGLWVLFHTPDGL
jgi:hypothetical protein